MRSTLGFPASPASSPGSTSTSGETLLSTPPPPSRPSHLIDLEKSSNISCSYICAKFTAHLQVIVLIYIVILCTLLKPYVTSQKKLICLCGSPIHVFSGGSVWNLCICFCSCYCFHNSFSTCITLESNVSMLRASLLILLSSCRCCTRIPHLKSKTTCRHLFNLLMAFSLNSNKRSFVALCLVSVNMSD